MLLSASGGTHAPITVPILKSRVFRGLAGLSPVSMDRKGRLNGRSVPVIRIKSEGRKSILFKLVSDYSYIDLTTSRHRIKWIETKSERHISFSPVWSSWQETSLSRSCSTENIKNENKNKLLVCAGVCV